MGDTWLNGDDHEFNSTYNAACFFAGYAVMRWHLGYPLGDVTINPDGTGQWDLPTETPLFEVDKPLPAQVHHGMVIHVEENDTRYFMQFPTPREQVLMRLAGVWAEHWTSLFLEGKKDPGKPCHHFLYSDISCEFSRENAI